MSVYQYIGKETSNDVISDEFFLKCICNYPALYNHKNKGYRNRQMTDRSWENVALSVGISVEQCQKKLKSLREKYHREKSKHNLKSGSGAQTQEQWPLMSFFDYMYDNKEPRETSSNYFRESEEETYMNQSETENIPGVSDLSQSYIDEVSLEETISSEVGTRPCSSSSIINTTPISNIVGKRKRKPPGPDPNPFSSTLQNVRKPTPTDKINRFVCYFESELRDISQNVCDDFIDETLIRLLQVKRKQRVN